MYQPFGGGLQKTVGHFICWKNKKRHNIDWKVYPTESQRL